MAVPRARTIIRERYQLESMIGEGGMASVWRARDLTLARSVAVKLLYARDDRDRSALTARFLREARIAASVQHRNVIQIVDFGTTEDELPFMVMELLEGEPLSGRMHRERQLPVHDVVQIGNLTLRGLAAVHNAGIIHRDLKPDNIYLKRESESVYPKILDFGISRSVEPQSGRRSALTTREGLIIGTPEYMSPEQARGVKDIDPRTDLYSMGVILYEAITGRLPFHSENVGDLIIQVVTGTAPTVHELMPNVPLEISKVIEHAMARKREDRFASATEMQAALLEAAGRIELRSAPRSYSDVPPPPPGGSGTRRLAPSERVTLDDPDALTEPRMPAPRARTPVEPPPSEPFSIVPPVTETGRTLILETPFANRVRRYGLPLAAAVAAIYAALMLLSATERGAFTPTPARANLTPPKPAPVPEAASPRPVAVQNAAVIPEPQLPANAALENVVGERPRKPAKAQDSPKARPRTRAGATAPASKPRKTQGALRNLDF